jgi:hypothetical protein
VRVPKASVNKDHLASRREYKVRAAWKARAMKPEPIAELMDELSHPQLGRSVFAFYLGHALAALSHCQRIHFLLLFF